MYKQLLNYNNWLIVGICTTLPALSYAHVATKTQPKFIITPVTASTVSLLPAGATTIQFQVTNNTPRTQYFYIDYLPTGVTLNTTSSGSGASTNCASITNLTPANSGTTASCLLSLNINAAGVLNGATAPKTVTKGPAVCETSAGNTNNQPLSCSQPPNPLTITIKNPGPAQKHAYINNYNAGTVARCDIDQSSGNLENCQNTATIGLNPTVPSESVNINAAHNLAYIGYASFTTSFTICDINTNAPASSDLANCSATVASSPSLPINGIGLAITPNGQYVYLSNYDGTTGSISRCTLDTSGKFNLSSCVLAGTNATSFPAGYSGPGFGFVGGLAINAAGTHLYAIASIFGSGSVAQCDIDGNNNIVNCSNPITGLTETIDIVLHPGGMFAYLVSQATLVFVCNVVQGGAMDGNLINCTANSGFVAINPTMMAINNTGTIAYVTDYGSNTVAQCNIDQGSGQLIAPCNDNTINGLLNHPTGIALL